MDRPNACLRRRFSRTFPLTAYLGQKAISRGTGFTQDFVVAIAVVARSRGRDQHSWPLGSFGDSLGEMTCAQRTAFENAAFFCFSPAAYHRLAGQMNYSFKTGDRLRSQRLLRIPRNLAFATRFAADQACDAVPTHLE